jgi:hypothetical protein
MRNEQDRSAFCKYADPTGRNKKYYMTFCHLVEPQLKILFHSLLGAGLSKFCFCKDRLAGTLSMSSQNGRETLNMLIPIKKMNHTHQQATCSGVLDAMRECMKREQILQARLHVHLHVTPYYPVATALLK